MSAIIIISIVFLSLILISDIKTRQIPVVFLLVETIASFYLRYEQIGILLMKVLVMNFAILGFQVLILWIWIKAKEESSESVLWSEFGQGDLFMLAILAINLSPFNYLFVTIITSLAAVIFWLGAAITRKIRSHTIPFAGFLAGGLIIIRILEMTGAVTKYNSENYFLNLIYAIH